MRWYTLHSNVKVCSSLELPEVSIGSLVLYHLGGVLAVTCEQCDTFHAPQQAQQSWKIARVEGSKNMDSHRKLPFTLENYLSVVNK